MKRNLWHENAEDHIRAAVDVYNQACKRLDDLLNDSPFLQEDIIKRMDEIWEKMTEKEAQLHLREHLPSALAKINLMEQMIDQLDDQVVARQRYAGMGGCRGE